MLRRGEERRWSQQSYHCWCIVRAGGDSCNILRMDQRTHRQRASNVFLKQPKILTDFQVNEPPSLIFSFLKMVLQTKVKIFNTRNTYKYQVDFRLVGRARQQLANICLSCVVVLQSCGWWHEYGLFLSQQYIMSPSIIATNYYTLHQPMTKLYISCFNLTYLWFEF